MLTLPTKSWQQLSNRPRQPVTANRATRWWLCTGSGLHPSSRYWISNRESVLLEEWHTVDKNHQIADYLVDYSDKAYRFLFQVQGLGMCNVVLSNFVAK